MENTFATIEELASSIKEYADTKVELAKLVIAEKISEIITNAIAGIVALSFLFLFFLFATIALGIGLGQWLGKPWLGFLLVAFFYLLIGIIAWSARVKILRLPIINLFINQLFTDKDEKD
jgi:Putative Actinobacterial Holin-X, holin superfamily III